MTAEDLKRMQKEVTDLKRKIYRGAEEVFPVGHLLDLYIRGYWRRVEILMWAFGRCEVRNIETKKEYWLDLYWLLYED